MGKLAKCIKKHFCKKYPKRCKKKQDEETVMADAVENDEHEEVEEDEEEEFDARKGGKGRRKKLSKVRGIFKIRYQLKEL